MLLLAGSTTFFCTCFFFFLPGADRLMFSGQDTRRSMCCHRSFAAFELSKLSPARRVWSDERHIVWKAGPDTCKHSEGSYLVEHEGWDSIMQAAFFYDKQFLCSRFEDLKEYLRDSCHLRFISSNKHKQEIRNGVKCPMLKFNLLCNVAL